MQMLDSLSESLQKGGDFSPARYILEQFIEFSDMHFFRNSWSCGCTAIRLRSASESHTHLMKKVREIRESVFRGESAPSLHLVQELRDWLLNHIAPRMWRLAISCARKKAAAPELSSRAAASAPLRCRWTLAGTKGILTARSRP